MTYISRIFFPELCQINPEKSREEFRSASQKDGGTGVKDFMDSMGLGMLAEQVNHIVLVAGIFPLIVPFLTV